MKKTFYILPHEKPFAMDEHESKALELAVLNALEHGKANEKAVLSKLLGAIPELRRDIPLARSIIQRAVERVNKLSEAELENLARELNVSLKKEKKEKTLPPLPGAEDGRVVTRMPPEPSKYPHLGHALSFLINYMYAEMYRGKCILRFEDTNPEKASQEYVDATIDGVVRYLGLKPSKTIFVSDNIPRYYEHADQLVERGLAYVCHCPPEKTRELRNKGLECECRSRSVEENRSGWEAMKKGEKREGECVLRLKIDMNHKNYAMRDPVIFRIVEKEHYRQGDRYKAWPLYDFENALEDHFCGVTHVLRSDEFGTFRIELQNWIRAQFGYPDPYVRQYGRFNLVGFETSGRKIREGIEKGLYSGWDDPRLVTLKALERRGIAPETFRELVLRAGLSKSHTNIDWTIVASINRRIVDKRADRFFMVREPIEVTIEGAPEKTVRIKKNPSNPAAGFRELPAGPRVYIEREDYEALEEGTLNRLMDYVNFEKKGDRLVFVSEDFMEYKKRRDGRNIHWIPVGFEENARILMDNGEWIDVLVERNAKSVEKGAVIQFERFGFARREPSPGLEFCFGHK